MFVFLKKKDYNMWSTVDKTFDELITWVWLPDKVETELELPVTARGGDFPREHTALKKRFYLWVKLKVGKIYMLILMVSLTFIVLRINHCWCVCLKKFISVFHPGPRETI